jgi:chromosome partitioning protein
MGGLISPLILARVDYQDAARGGRGVTELNPSGAAAQEMCGLWQSITAHLAQAEVGRPARKAA